MSWSPDSVRSELARAGRFRISQAVKVAAVDPSDGISASTLLAIASRETNIRNIESYAKDASGVPYDTGALQFNRRAHRYWLASVRGCVSGSWNVANGHTPAEAGYVPQWTPSLYKACELLAWNVEYAISQGVRPGERVRFAIAGWNCGPWSALTGYREGNVDKHTTGGDYSYDVLLRRKVVQEYLVERGYVA